MDPFNVYKTYLALRLHFTNPKYDITKTRGAVKASQAAFQKRKDILSMRKLARDYTKREVIDFLVANFVAGDRWGGMFDTNAEETYKQWKNKKQNIDYIIEQDFCKIELEMEKQEIDNPLTATDGQHPLIYRLYFGHLISLETLVILDKLYNYVIIQTDDIFLQDLNLLITKYKPFVQNGQKFLERTSNFV